jgi:hypothetical protein
MAVVLLGFCSHAFPVNDYVQCSVSPRAPCGLGDETQVAVDDDDPDDASDDLVLLRYTSNGSSSGATLPSSLGGEKISGSSYLRASATLESQHALLRA